MEVKKGNTAEVFEFGEGKVCKLFDQGFPREYVELEYENARKLFAMGIPGAKPFQVIEREGRNGILYEKIEGTLLCDSMDGDWAVKLFAGLHKKILALRTNELMPYQDFLIAMVGRKGEAPKKVIEKIRALPKGDYVLHGDYHPENVMISVTGEGRVIDFLNVCCGPREYDVARTYFLLDHEVWRENYLREMGYERADLKRYLEVVDMVRRYEV